MMKKGRRAIVFTLDALLAIPLLLLIMGTLITFAATFKESILAHEYVYIVARDTMVRLAELKVKDYGAAQLGATKWDENLTIAEFIGKKIDAGEIDAARGIFENFFTYPYGYDFEFLKGNEWKVIASKPKENYQFEVPYLLLVAARTLPEIKKLEDCPTTVACPATVEPRYKPGKLIGPIMLRLRVKA